MQQHKHNKRTVQLIIALILLTLIISQSTLATQKNLLTENSTISYHKVIQEGKTIMSRIYQQTPMTINNYLKSLKIWYQNHPDIEFASLSQNTITLKFIDGNHILLIEPLNMNIDKRLLTHPAKIKFLDNLNPTPATNQEKTAIILNPSENMYGNFQCRRIITMLQSKNYNITHKINIDVTISYLRYNFSANIIYMNTHAGVWDLNGDEQPDIVVIGTGEYWTNETPDKYPFEFENQMIVEGIVGDTSYISFTPDFIYHYYSNNTMPSSLVYMATCHATFDDTMATAFLNAGAETYIGWTQNTVFWTNSLTSILAFRLFTLGFTVKQVCKLIGYGGFYNFIFQSKLVSYGNENYKLPN